MSKQYDITIPKKIIDDLVHIENEMSKILKDDNELLCEIVEKLLLFDKPDHNDVIVCEEEINQCVWKKYPDLYSNTNHQDKSKILDHIFDITMILKGEYEEKIYNKIEQMSYEKRLASIKDYRKIIENEIIKIFYPGDFVIEENYEKESTLIGDVSE